MKPSLAISAIVIAVLATIAIEEYRISELRGELIRLRAIRDDPSLTDATPPKPSTTPATAGEAQAPPVEPAGAAEPPAAATPAPVPGQRQIPDDFPAPSDDEIKASALGPYSDLHYQLGLSNRARAYLEELLIRRSTTQQDLAMKWVKSSDAERPAAKQALHTALEKNDAEIKAFLNRDTDFETFSAFQSMHAERQMLSQLNLLMGQEGIALELAKEKQLITAMYQARIGASALEWDSPAALPVIAAGGALERFDREWEAQSLALKAAVASILTEQEAISFLASREQLKNSIRSSIEAAAQALLDHPEAAETPE